MSEKTYPRLIRPPRQSFFLLDVRGVGKNTWVLHPANNTEVDFLLCRVDELIVLEVKSQPRYHTSMLPRLRTIEEFPGVARRVLIYGAKRTFRNEDGIDVLVY